MAALVDIERQSLLEERNAGDPLHKVHEMGDPAVAVGEAVPAPLVGPEADHADLDTRGGGGTDLEGAAAVALKLRKRN